MLGASIFTIVISSWTDPLIIMQCPSLSVVIVFILKSIFFDIRIATPAFFFYYYLFIYLFILAVLGLRFCARAFSSCGKRGPLFITVRGPLTVAASLVAEHKLQTCMLSSCGSRAQLLRVMWGLPRPGPEPVSTVLAGRISTTVPAGKPNSSFLLISICMEYLFPSPHFQSVCVPRSEAGLLQTAYIQVLFLYPFSQSVSFGGSI